MTQEEIEGNKLIAEFMGATKGFNSREGEFYYLPDRKPTYLPTELKYHDSFDWLMPVVEKIESLNLGTLKVNRFGNEHDAGFDTTFRNANVVFRIEYKDVHIDLVGDMQIWEGWKHIDKYHSKKEAVWFAVVEFIKWYNQNKQS